MVSAKKLEKNYNNKLYLLNRYKDYVVLQEFRDFYLSMQ